MHVDSSGLTVAIALAVGLAAQALARHLRIPGIVLLLAAGALLGPDVAGVVDPETLGPALEILVGYAVAVILFEGGLNLNLGRLRRQAKVIRRLISTGALITAAGGTLLAHLVMGLGWRVSVVFGAVVIVTGPQSAAARVRDRRRRRRRRSGGQHQNARATRAARVQGAAHRHAHRHALRFARGPSPARRRPRLGRARAAHRPRLDGDRSPPRRPLQHARFRAYHARQSVHFVARAAGDRRRGRLIALRPGNDARGHRRRPATTGARLHGDRRDRAGAGAAGEPGRPPARRAAAQRRLRDPRRQSAQHRAGPGSARRRGARGRLHRQQIPPRSAERRRPNSRTSGAAVSRKESCSEPRSKPDSPPSARRRTRRSTGCSRCGATKTTSCRDRTPPCRRATSASRRPRSREAGTGILYGEPTELELWSLRFERGRAAVEPWIMGESSDQTGALEAPAPLAGAFLPLAWLSRKTVRPFDDTANFKPGRKVWFAIWGKREKEVRGWLDRNGWKPAHDEAAQ